MHSIIYKLSRGSYEALLNLNPTKNWVHEHGRIDEVAQLRLQIEVQSSTLHHSTYRNINKSITSLLQLRSHEVCRRLYGVDNVPFESCGNLVIKTISDFPFYFSVDEVAKSGSIDVHHTAWSNGLRLVHEVGILVLSLQLSNVLFQAFIFGALLADGSNAVSWDLCGVRLSKHWGSWTCRMMSKRLDLVKGILWDIFKSWKTVAIKVYCVGEAGPGRETRVGQSLQKSETILKLGCSNHKTIGERLDLLAYIEKGQMDLACLLNRAKTSEIKAVLKSVIDYSLKEDNWLPVNGDSKGTYYWRIFVANCFGCSVASMLSEAILTPKGGAYVVHSRSNIIH